MRTLEKTKKIMTVLVLLVALSVAPSVQAQSVEQQQENDPIESFNRFMFGFNDILDTVLFRPVAFVYGAVLPGAVRGSIRNFLENLGEPVTLANDVLQGQGSRAGNTTLRFLINSTAGVGGLFDVAGEFGYQRHFEDFGQTLGVWGVPSGPYIVLPILGPSNPRDAIGLVADVFTSPFYWIAVNNDAEGYLVGVEVLKAIDARERNLKTIDKIKADSFDYYATIRSLYGQSRASKIANKSSSDIDFDNLPDYDFEE